MGDLWPFVRYLHEVDRKFRAGDLPSPDDLRTAISSADPMFVVKDYLELPANDRADLLAEYGTAKHLLAVQERSRPIFDEAFGKLAEAIRLVKGDNELKAHIIVRTLHSYVDCYRLFQDDKVLPAADFAAQNATILFDGLKDTPIGQQLADLHWDDDYAPTESLRCRNLMGALYRLRYAVTGNSDDLDRSIMWLRSALTPNRFDFWPLRDNACDLVNALLVRYGSSGFPGDLALAVTVAERLQTEVPEGDPPRPAYRAALAAALMQRYWSAGGEDGKKARDLDRSIDLWRIALLDSPTGDWVETAREQLAIALATRWWIGKDENDRAAATKLAEGRNLQPPGDRWPRLLLDVVQQLLLGSNGGKDEQSLGVAISLAEEVHAKAERGTRLAGEASFKLAAGLQMLFYRNGQKETISRAVELAREALARIEPGSREWAEAQYLLALCLRTRVIGLPRGEGVHVIWASQDDTKAATEAFAKAAETCLPLDKRRCLKMAVDWGTWVADHSWWGDAARAYRIALLALHGLLRGKPGKRETGGLLLRSLSLASRSAYALAAVGDFAGALVALERGRAVLSHGGQAADRPDSWVEEVFGEDAEAVRERYEQLEAEEEPDPWGMLGHDNFLGYSGVSAARASAVWEDQRAGRLPLKSAFRTSTLGEVQEVAGQSPVLYLVTSMRGGLALLVTKSQGIQAAWVAELKEAAVRTQVNSLYEAYRRRHEDEASFPNALLELSAWLWGALVEDLAPLLQDESHLLVVPTGLFGLLPLGLAGEPPPPPKEEAPSWGRLLFSRVKRLFQGPPVNGPPGKPQRYAFDGMAISFVPTAGFMRRGVAALGKRSCSSAFVVNDPAPTPYPRLVYSPAECAAIGRHISPVTQLDGQAATLGQVMNGMGEHGLLHLSCHGLAEPDEPMDSALVLADGARLSVQDLQEANLAKARLVVLSACESAVVGRALPDEVIGLPLAFLAAGVPGVVGSLWSVPGPGTLLVMMRFYDLWAGQRLSPAKALRLAQQWVRDTTNGEKAEALAQLLPPELAVKHPEVRTLISVLNSAPSARDFDHPFHWGGFVCLGV
jgi:hypothetical protein